MRTTVTIEDTLLAEAKVLAARSGRTVGSVVEDALREMIARHARSGPPLAVELPVSGNAQDRPLVDILDKNALAVAVGDESL